MEFHKEQKWLKLNKNSETFEPLNLCASVPNLYAPLWLILMLNIK
jgi:hypothetical protein